MIRRKIKSFSLVMSLVLLGGLGAGDFSCEGGDDCPACAYVEIEDLINEDKFDEAISKAEQFGFRDLQARAQLGKGLQSIDLQTVLEASSKSDFLNALQGADATALNAALDSGALEGDQFAIAMFAFMASTGANSPGPPSDSQVNKLVTYMGSLDDVSTEISDAMKCGDTYCTDWASLCAGPLSGEVAGC